MKYTVLNNKDELIVLTEDGGVGITYKGDDTQKVTIDLYHDRLDINQTLDNLFDNSKMSYVTLFCDFDVEKDNIINHILNWMCPGIKCEIDDKIVDKFKGLRTLNASTLNE